MQSSPELLKYAKECGITFETMASEGNVELLFYRPNGDKGPIFILEEPNTGDGIEHLQEATGVLCYPDAEFLTNGVEALFGSAEEAISHVADLDFRSALIWSIPLGALEGTVVESAMACIDWTKESKRHMEKFNLSYQELVDKIIYDSPCDVVKN